MTGIVTTLFATPMPFADMPFLVVLGLGMWTIKLLGYFWFARWLCLQYPEVDVNPAFFACCRATLGVAVGVSWIALLGWGDPGPSAHRTADTVLSPTAAWYGALIGSRVLEWVAMLWVFFGRHVGRRAWTRVAKHAAIGSGWSLALDGFVGLLSIVASIVGYLAG